MSYNQGIRQDNETKRMCDCNEWTENLLSSQPERSMCLYRVYMVEIEKGIATINT